MYYIIFDLEWNSAYNYSAGKFMNEIIEIGAVKLDNKLNIVDTFKQLVIPRYTKKLSSRCKRLTNITNEEIKENGIPFEEAFADFSVWSRGEKNIFLSWSNSDLYVLSNNFLENFGSCRVSFINQYCDAQKYCMSQVEQPDGNKNQISLANYAELMNIQVDTEKLHRALSDCYVTAECFKAVFDEAKLKPFIKKCDENFFARLLFKPYYITEPRGEFFNIDKVELACPRCGKKVLPVREYQVQNKAFKGPARCTGCQRSYWSFIRVKKNYDDIAVKKSFVEMNKKRARRINKQPKQENSK